jgi:2-aminoadipate transaminase
LQYGTTQGYQPLREKVAQLVAGLDAASHYTVSDVVITTGSQQMLYLLSELLLNPGDVVITEAPSYFVYHAVLANRGVEVIGIPMDDDGMQIDELQKVLNQLQKDGRQQKLKMLYTVDYYQNPSGRTLSFARRQQLMGLLNSLDETYQFIVLEDAAYRELRFDGPGIPSLKSMDVENRWVVYAGTFSKPCAPGFKSGYAILLPELVEPLCLIKGNHDFGSGNLSQHLIVQMLETGTYASHVLDLQAIYKVKRDAILAALEAEFSGLPGVRWTHPHGGMFVWLKFPDHVATNMHSAFAKAALKAEVLYVPGIYAYRGPQSSLPDCELRLAFGDASPEKLREGIKRLRIAYDGVISQAKSLVPSQNVRSPKTEADVSVLT